MLLDPRDICLSMEIKPSFIRTRGGKARNAVSNRHRVFLDPATAELNSENLTRVASFAGAEVDITIGIRS